MSCIKRWLEDHINEFSYDELREMGYSDEEIKIFRESFPNPKESH